MHVTITGVARDEGTVVLFDAYDHEDGRALRVAVDHRLAQALVDALAAGDVPEASIEAWQVVHA